MGHGNAICFTVEYDVKEVIPFLMTIFYYLNPTVQTMSIVPSDGPNGVAIEIKEEDIDILVSDYPWKNPPEHLLLENCSYFGGYLFHYPSV